MLKIRLLPAPLMASAEVPGPMIVRFLATTNSLLARVIVPVTPKTMKSPAVESAITCRNEPAPLSAREVTVFVAEWAKPAKASTSTTVIVKSELVKLGFEFITDSFLFAGMCLGSGLGQAPFWTGPEE
jgi:hypothetical protein